MSNQVPQYTLRQVTTVPKLGSADSLPSGAVVVQTRQGGVDISDIFRVHVDLGNALAQFHANPYDHRPLQAMRHIGTRSIPLFNQLHNLTDPEQVVRISAQHEVNFLPPPG